MAARLRRLTKLELLDREIETLMARLAVEVGIAPTIAEARKEFRAIYPTSTRRRRHLRVLAGGRT